MAEDLTTKETEGQEIEDVEVETTSRADYVAACYNAISAMDGLDLFTKQDAIRKARIIRKSVRIIDDIISELYDELFEDDED